MPCSSSTRFAPLTEKRPRSKSWEPLEATAHSLMPMTDWNPILYSKFEAERMRAARDLLAEVPLAAAALVYDLGCGPGNSAELLLRRFPDAPNRRPRHFRRDACACAGPRAEG